MNHQSYQNHVWIDGHSAVQQAHYLAEEKTPLESVIMEVWKGNGWTILNLVLFYRKAYIWIYQYG